MSSSMRSADSETYCFFVYPLSRHQVTVGPGTIQEVLGKWVCIELALEVIRGNKLLGSDESVMHVDHVHVTHPGWGVGVYGTSVTYFISMPSCITIRDIINCLEELMSVLEDCQLFSMSVGHILGSEDVKKLVEITSQNLHLLEGKLCKFEQGVVSKGSKVDSVILWQGGGTFWEKVALLITWLSCITSELAIELDLAISENAPLRSG